MKFETEGQERRRGSWRGGSKLEDLGSAGPQQIWGSTVSSHSRVWGRALTTLDALRDQETRLAAANVI